MNERIKQLAEQSFIITTDGKIGHVNTLMVEKFAELIVRECADIAIREDHDPAECIKKHFGVAEREQ